MSDKVQVAAIEIQYPDGECKKLTVEEARELHRQLEALFGARVTVQPSYPVIIERDSWPRWGQPSVTWSSDPFPERPQVWCSAAALP